MSLTQLLADDACASDIADAAAELITSGAVEVAAGSLVSFLAENGSQWTCTEMHNVGRLFDKLGHPEVYEVGLQCHARNYEAWRIGDGGSEDEGDCKGKRGWDQ